MGGNKQTQSLRTTPYQFTCGALSAVIVVARGNSCGICCLLDLARGTNGPCLSKPIRPTCRRWKVEFHTRVTRRTASTESARRRAPRANGLSRAGSAPGNLRERDRTRADATDAAICAAAESGDVATVCKLAKARPELVNIQRGGKFAKIVALHFAVLNRGVAWRRLPLKVQTMCLKWLSHRIQVDEARGKCTVLASGR
jgi:hypothetical protein